jgi:hypothetical protein
MDLHVLAPSNPVDRTLLPHSRAALPQPCLPQNQVAHGRLRFKPCLFQHVRATLEDHDGLRLSYLLLSLTVQASFPFLGTSAPRDYTLPCNTFVSPQLTYLPKKKAIHQHRRFRPSLLQRVHPL